MTAQEVATMFNLSVKSVRRYYKRKVRPLPSYQVMGTIRFRKDQVLRWLDDEQQHRASSLGMFLGTYGRVA